MEKIEFERNGECNRCGFCCMMLPHWNDLNDIQRALYRIYDKNAENVFRKVIRSRCSFLKTNGNGTTNCLLFENKNRPKFCELFPNHPNQLKEIPNCSYEFVKKSQKVKHNA